VSGTLRAHRGTVLLRGVWTWRVLLPVGAAAALCCVIGSIILGASPLSNAKEKPVAQAYATRSVQGANRDIGVTADTDNALLMVDSSKSPNTTHMPSAELRGSKEASDGVAQTASPAADAATTAAASTTSTGESAVVTATVTQATSSEAAPMHKDGASNATIAAQAGVAAALSIYNATATTTTNTVTAPPSDIEDGLPAVCNGKKIKAIKKREKWLVQPWLRDQCWGNVIRDYQKGGDRLKARMKEDADRNWCWVGLKETCHSTLFPSDVRPHKTWKELRETTPWFAPPAPMGTFRALRDEWICDRREYGAVQKWTKEEWDTAWKWFKQYVAVYVLNLKTDRERYEVMKQDLQKLGIHHTRIEGVDMRAEGAIQSVKREGIIPTDWDFNHAQKKANNRHQAMGGILGTVGCASAHFRAQTVAYERTQVPMAIVLEDDVQLSEDFVPKLWTLVNQELPCDWQVLSLRSMCPYGTCVSKHLTRVQPDHHEPADRCHHGTNYGFQGVMYRIKDLREIQQKWKQIVFNASRPHCLDVDVSLAAMADDVRFYAVPFSQFPGFLRERREGSARFSINNKHLG